MPVFNVDSSHVSTAAATADQSAEAIRTEVATMMAFLQGLADTWGGTAATSFQSVIEQWRATQAQVEDSLTTIGAHLHQAAATYSDAESQATALFAG